MCGIAGLVPIAPTEAGTVVPLEPLERAAERLAARGPDARWVGRHGSAALAATRLAIVERTKACDPPILDATGSVALLYNGEVYGARSLRQELSTRGHRFRTRGDGELVLAAYLEWGPRFLREIDGMFALAIVDRREETSDRLPSLLLARDRFGEKPLVFARTSRGLAFASTTAALAPLLDRVEPDPGVLAAIVRHGFAPRGESALRGAFRLRQGTALSIRGGEATVLPFAEHTATPIPPEGGIDAWASRFWALLRAAVERRAHSEVGVGLFLSGGLDSGALALALSEEGLAATAFSAGFAGERDERPRARETARAAGLPWRTVEIGSEVLATWLPLTRAIGEPLADASVLNLHALAAAARREVGVVLSGEGGDELFGGYRRERAFDAIGALRLPSAFGSTLAALPGDAGRVGRALARKPGIGRYQELRDHVAEAEELLLPEFRRGDEPAEEGLPETAGARASDLHSYLPNDLLLRLDGATMAASLEARAPFLDPDLADFAASLPSTARRGWRSGKRVLRRALEGKLPGSVLRGRKRGFGPPLARWFRETPFLETVLLERGASEPPLDRRRVEAACRDHRRGRDRSLVLARAVAVELHRRVLRDDGGSGGVQ